MMNKCNIGVNMWDVVFFSMSFWITFIVCQGLAYVTIVAFNGLDWTYFDLKYQGIFALISFILIYAINFMFFTYGTGATDTEIWNGCITKANYYEEWTEKYYVTICDGRDTKGNCTSSHEEERHTYHPPYWDINFSTGYVKSISSADYKNYVNKFGEKFENIMRLNQVGGGGDKYVSDVPFGALPASHPNSYINYIRASEHTIEKNNNNIQQYQKYILSYPSFMGTPYGDFDFIRVIQSNLNYNSDLIYALDKQLDLELVSLGTSKQVNIIVYLVGTEDQNFYNALETSWVKSKKNDVVVVVGLVNKEIKWSQIMAWTDNELFKVALKNKIMDMKVLNDTNFLTLGKLITDQIRGNGESGYNRKEMKDYEYLKYDISLTIDQILIIIILSMVLTVVATIGYLKYNK